MNTHRQWYLGIALSLLLPALVAAGNLPFSFSAGTPIRASEINANFVSLQAQVNTIPGVSGARLATYGLSSTDGLRIQLITPPPTFDTQLGVYCAPATADDGKLRCLPFSAVDTSTFSDSSCTVSLYASGAPSYSPYPTSSLPAETAIYLRLPATGTGSTVFQAVPFLGQRYVRQPSPLPPYSSCVPVDAGGAAFSLGATVSASQFAEFSVVKY